MAAPEIGAVTSRVGTGMQAGTGPAMGAERGAGVGADRSTGRTQRERHAGRQVVSEE